MRSTSASHLPLATALACLLGLTAGAAPASAQILFGADLTGAQENPPVTTDAGGFATFVVNPDDSVTYRVLAYGLSATAAHIHDGDVGVNGPIVFGLAGGPTTFTGTTPALNAAQLTDLRAGGYYVNLHTAANPGGEIRGQIEARPLTFGAHADGGQEVPPVVTGETGDMTLQVNSDLTMTYDLTTNVTNGTAAHIHLGDFGANGGVVFGLAGGPLNWSGTTGALSVAQFNALQSQGYYVNVHTSDNPGGKIRGQITASSVPYGPPCASSVGGTPTLTVTGAPVSEGNITLNISGGLPGGVGFLFTSFTDGATKSKGPCNYLLGAPFLILKLNLNGSGALTLPASLPSLTGSFDFYLQYMGLDGASPHGGRYNTNGLKIPFTTF